MAKIDNKRQLNIRQKMEKFSVKDLTVKAFVHETMTTSELPRSQKQKSRSRQILQILIQVVLMVVIFAALFWYVGVGSIYNALLQIKVEYLLLAFLMYFGINLLFTVRLRRVLSKNGVKTSFGKTLLAQYAGMLTSDVTPGRSGYILTPVYLRDQDVPTSKSLSSVLGIQTFEFLIKVIGGIGAVIYLVNFVPAHIWNKLFPVLIFKIPSTNIIINAGNAGLIVAIIGIALMMAGALILAAFTWSKRAISIFDRIANSRYLKRFTGSLIGRLEEYKESSGSTSKAIPEIVLLTLACWILKGFEWYFLGYALGITQIPWIAYFLIHPLVTALAFVPITPAGIGVQEFGIIGIFGLLAAALPGVPTTAAQIAAFALLARGLLIFEDLVGVPQIVKSTSLIFSRKKPDASIEPEPPKPI